MADEEITEGTPNAESAQQQELTPEQRRLANLRAPWSKGESGNPAGRPVGSRNRSTVAKFWLECNAQDGFEGTMEDEIWRKQITKARDGDQAAAGFVLDAAYGKQADIHEHGGIGGGPIRAENTNVNAEGTLSPAELKQALAARGLPTEIFEK